MVQRINAMRAAVVVVATLVVCRRSSSVAALCGLRTPSFTRWTTATANAGLATRAEPAPRVLGGIETARQFQAILDESNADGTRPAVLVVGAGLHRQLQALTRRKKLARRWETFTDWNGLLSSIADAYDLPRIAHEDPAATWEGTVARIVAATGETGGAGGNAAATTGSVTAALRPRDAEQQAFKMLAKELKGVPADHRALEWLGGLLLRFRDVVCLNYDPALDMAAKEVGAKVSRVSSSSSKARSTLGCSFTWTAQGRHGRVWNPHGQARCPSRGIILGTTSYGQALSAVTRAWNHAKQAERLHESGGGPAYWQARRAVTPFEPRAENGQRLLLTWVDLFLTADLLIIGTSLDRAEVDLWWSLQQRQRNLARVPEAERPKTLVLCGGRGPQHLSTGPAGISVVPFDSWSEAWQSLNED